MIEKTTWFQLQPLYQHLRQQAENRKSYKYFEISATFFLIAIFLFTAIAPTAKAISNLIGEIKSKQILEEKLKKKINSIILAQDNYSLMQEPTQYQILESSFPSRPRYYQSALTFSSGSQQAKTSLSRLSFNLSQKTPSDTKTEQNLYGISLSTLGDYRSSLEMINKIINNRRIVDIGSLQLGQQDKKEKSSTGSAYIDLSLSTNLFYLPTILNEQK